MSSFFSSRIIFCSLLLISVSTLNAKPFRDITGQDWIAFDSTQKTFLILDCISQTSTVDQFLSYIDQNNLDKLKTKAEMLHLVKTWNTEYYTIQNIIANIDTIYADVININTQVYLIIILVCYGGGSYEREAR